MNFRKILPSIIMVFVNTSMVAQQPSLTPTDSLAIALHLVDLSFTAPQLDSMTGSVHNTREMLRDIHKASIPNDLPLSLVFTPPLNKDRIPTNQLPVNWNLPKKVELPSNKNDLAFYTVWQLGYLIRNKKITSLELTQFFIDRLKKYGDTLSCVVTITDSLALAQARRADAEIAKGIYRGPLHGIPYGAKDLLAVEGYNTTFGAMPYKDQRLPYTSTVIKKLEAAGGVLVAKLTLGALAWGDVWYGGQTKNPWNLSAGSSGSSAGSASATTAGLVPFAIGSETWGSIVSPATRCGATGLRPTYGRVSKTGAMTLSWTMDKIGPLCRNATDCALVFDIIRGEDGVDLSVTDHPFNYDYSKDIKKLRVGVLTDEFNPAGAAFTNDSITLQLIKSKGIKLMEKKLPVAIPVYALSFLISAEGAAAFDDLTRSGRDTLMVRQIKNAWPNVFRAARLVPAVEYIQANRLRDQLTREFNEMMKDIDVLIAPSFNTQLLMTNLTGHPCVVLPNGSYASGTPGTITLLGNHFDEASVLMFARFLQDLTPYEDEHPPLFRN